MRSKIPMKAVIISTKYLFITAVMLQPKSRLPALAPSQIRLQRYAMPDQPYHFSTPHESREKIMPHFAQKETHRSHVPHDCRHCFDCLTYFFLSTNVAPQQVLALIRESCSYCASFSSRARLPLVRHHLARHRLLVHELRYRWLSRRSRARRSSL